MPNIHVITGEDSFSVERAARAFVAKDGALEIIDSLQSANADAQLADIGRFAESVATPPFLDPAKTTWWKNVHFLAPSGGRRGAGGEDGEGGGGGKVSAEVKAALERTAEAIAASPPPPNQTVVISAPSMRRDSRFAKALAKTADFTNLAAPSPFEADRVAAAAAMDAAGELSFRFAPGAVEAFIATVGRDTRSIHSEVAKLRDWLGPGAGVATVADVEAVASPGAGAEPAFWALQDAFGARDTKAVAKYALIFCTGKNTVASITMIESFVRRLLAVKDAGERGRLAEATEGTSPYAARKNAAFAAKWSLTELRAARAKLMNLRERLVSSGDGAADFAVAALLEACVRRRA